MNLFFSLKATNEHHGCPFKNFSDSNLIILLRKMGVDTSQSTFSIIMQKKREGHFQVNKLIESIKKFTFK